jgi:hypothetical protein
MKLHKAFDSLCSPARFYFGLSVFIILMLLGQNLFNGDPNELCVGAYKCNFPNVALLLVFKTIYVLFWTWLLNYLCVKGLKNLSWFIVLIPLLLLAVGLAAIILHSLTISEARTAAQAKQQQHSN